MNSRQRVAVVVAVADPHPDVEERHICALVTVGDSKELLLRIRTQTWTRGTSAPL